MCHRENQEYLHIVYNLLHFVAHVRIIVLLATFINKFNAMLPFQNLRNVNIAHICSIYVFYKATLSLSRISHSTPFL